MFVYSQTNKSEKNALQGKTYNLTTTTKKKSIVGPLHIFGVFSVVRMTLCFRSQCFRSQVILK